MNTSTQGIRQLFQAIRTDAPMLLLVAVEQENTGGVGVPCRVVGTVGLGQAQAPEPSAPPREDGRMNVGRLLTAIGVPMNLLGYAYLCTAVEVMVREPEKGHGLMRGVYPEVAGVHGTTARCVERAIRHAIAQAWARGGGEAYERLLGRMSSTVGDRPTNGEFLAQVAEKIRQGNP